MLLRQDTLHVCGHATRTDELSKAKHATAEIMRIHDPHGFSLSLGTG
jgi:hypothetical protein